MASDVNRGEEISTRRGRLVGVHRHLGQPRQVIANEYVETPLRPIPHLLSSPATPKPTTESRSCRHSDFALVTLPAIPPSAVVTPSLAVSPSDGIICRDCGKCRCAACRTPRPLPSRWLCGSACLCSGTTIVETATCMCVPKAVWYHCTNDEDRRSRPSLLCLALSTIFLPCLACYWPCRGLLHVCEQCHRRLKTPGCRCRELYRQTPMSSPAPTPQPHAPPLEKRLLDMD